MLLLVQHWVHSITVVSLYRIITSPSPAINIFPQRRYRSNPMATSLAFFRPTMVRASASSSGKPDPNTRKPVSRKWWSPLFGWSSDPDYVDPVVDQTRNTTEGSVNEHELVRARSKFAPGCFTEEKARRLRRKTMESSTFHDVMYHSAIASRLASDFSKRPEIH